MNGEIPKLYSAKTDVSEGSLVTRTWPIGQAICRHVTEQMTSYTPDTGGLTPTQG